MLRHSTGLEGFDVLFLDGAFDFVVRDVCMTISLAREGFISSIAGRMS